MGYNTTIFILNDAFDQIKKHPEQFVEGINRQMHDGGNVVVVGNHYNPVKVMPTAHADVPRLYFTHGNSIIDMSERSSETLWLATSEHEFQREFVDRSIARARKMLDDLEAKIASERASVEEECNTCGDAGRWETTLEEVPDVLVDLGECPDCDNRQFSIGALHLLPEDPA